MPITTVIFDLGNVLIPLHNNRMKAKFAELGVKNSDRFFSTDGSFKDPSLKRLYETFETNAIDVKAFRTTLKIKLEIPNATDADIDTAWNSMLGEISEARFKMLEGLRDKKFRVILLSNSNSIHYDFLQKQYGTRFKTIFHKEYFSQLLSTAKPSPEIYKHVLSDSKSNANESLFFDDRTENIEGAKHVGIHAKRITIETPESVVIEEINRIHSLETQETIKTIGLGAAVVGAALAGLFALKTAMDSSSNPIPPAKPPGPH